MILLIFLISSGTIYCAPISYVTDSSKVVSFANYLYKTKDYEAAITEYNRSLFLGTSDTSAVFLQLGRTYSLLGKRKLARSYLNLVKDDTSFALISFSYLEEKELKPARQSFFKIKDTTWQNKINTHWTDLLNLPHKNSLIAGFSSAIIPGLGRAYSGRWGDGIFSFLFTVGSFCISYRYYKTDDYIQSATIGTLGVLFYIGDIYGSVQSAKLYNEKVFYDKLEEFSRDFDYLY